jgi:hypothetical protein
MRTTENEANEIYAELQKLVGKTDYVKVYQTMNRLFLRIINQQTSFQHIRFGGPFAKTDYLLREHHADRYLQRIVNDARVRFRKYAQMPQDELRKSWADDLKALCLFVQLIYHAAVPSLLEIHFPLVQRTKGGQPVTDCLRVIVERVEAEGLVVNADWEGADELRVCLDKNEQSPYDWDWNDLRDVLSKGSQLNLVHPRIVNGVVYPELIVYEPDYLVDISSIASCFESYATSPLIYLLNKLKPSVPTSAIILGNLASQFLDEELSLTDGTRSYGDSVKTFFQNNSLALLTTPLDSDFHQQAYAQQLNIRQAIRRGLKQHVSSFDPKNVMVEPSFFSEMLGLQGRMDFLQLDQRILIEQKSGKGGYPQQDPDTPVTQEKHYVQMLLYSMLLRYNYRRQFEKNGFGLSSFLLYSRYKNGLIGQGYAPDLAYKAMQVRNGIVANEFRFTRGGIRILDTLTADDLNEQHVSGRLWDVYQRPQLEALLQPIHDATPLERAYYFRFLTFIATEHLLAKVGTQTKENSGFADKWYSSLEVKLQAGNIYSDLELLSPSDDEQGKVDMLVLQLPARPDNEIANFRKGDIVVLYPYAEDEEPDVRRTMVFRCTIDDITEGRITLSLRAMQTDARVFWYREHCKWAMEHDFFESSFSSLYRGMHAFLSAPRHRRDLILLQCKPTCDETLQLKDDYGAFNPLALRVKQARDLFLIIGPPGTGKTSFGLMTTLNEALLDAESRVLLMAYTNRAVDEICSKLVEQGIDFIRIGGRHACEREYVPYLLDFRAADCDNVEKLRQMVGRTRVFVGTTTALSSNAALFQVCRFSLAVIDEASQILEPHLMTLLSAKTPEGDAAIGKLVLIGDHKQLPAVVQQTADDSRVDDPLLQSVLLTDCRLSLFERLLKAYRHDEHVVYMLTRQGRMHHEIAEFPNQSFYEGRLTEVPCAHQLGILPPLPQACQGIESLLLSRRVAFVSIPAPTDSVSDKVNQNEAEAIAATVHAIYQLHPSSFVPTQTVGIIVPYRNQIATIRCALEKYDCHQLRDVTIDTVERFQGSQRDYIIYGFTVQHAYQLGFLTDYVFEENGNLIDRKLNVAMTRAREHLLLFGNTDLLAYDEVFGKLISYMRRNDSLVEVGLQQFLTGFFKVADKRQ